ncbi:hypothetical protein M758_8G110000 [Ceratodon purpureus]|nr:hypothetical protein M758_8G110000 [Ceratodon purpureus]
MEAGDSSHQPGESPSDVSIHLETLPSIPAEPPHPPKIKYYYSNVVAKNVSYIYRVVEEGDQLICYPEAKGWPRLTITNTEELEKNFKLLANHEIMSKKPDLASAPEQVRFPDLEELRSDWQVGTDVYFRYCDIRTPGKVVGRFVWRTPTNRGWEKKLRLVLLLQLPTNELILSSQVTDLAPSDQSTNKEEVYIQGISLISVVATLIANVAYLASVSPIRGIDESRQGVAVASYLPVPKLFLFFNAFAFYAAVLAVVLMTAFIPIYGTAGEWGAIFLSGSVPVVLSLVAFYVAFMISAWAVLDSWGTSLGISLVGVLMVVYVRFWAIELMHGNVDRELEIASRESAWEWYNGRLADGEGVMRTDEGAGVRESFSPSERVAFLVEKVSFVAEKVRQFVVSPTIWQLSVLGTVQESQKARRKSRVLFEHLGKAHGH